jgi:hypothetical protein
MELLRSAGTARKLRAIYSKPGKCEHTTGNEKVTQPTNERKVSSLGCSPTEGAAVGRGTYGQLTRFAITVGEILSDNGGSRRVDVWAADRWLTCEDNNVYVPHFAGCLQRAVGALLSDPTDRRLGRPYPELSAMDNYRRLRADAETDNSEHLAYRFMDWGPTADNVGMLIFREGGTVYLPFSFWRPDHHVPSELGQVFVAELPERELATVLHEAAWALMWDWADRNKWPRQSEQDAANGGLLS